MTEQEFLTSDNPAVMLVWVSNNGSGPGQGPNKIPLSNRRLRLFTAAALRYLLSRGDPPATVHQRAAILELERFADDGCEEGLSDAWRDANLPRPGIALATNAAARIHAQMMAEYPMADMRAFCCHALREIVGNPFQSVILPWNEARGVWKEGRLKYLEQRCSWLTPIVLSLAQAAYDERPGRKCETCKGEKTIPIYGPPRVTHHCGVRMQERRDSGNERGGCWPTWCPKCWWTQLPEHIGYDGCSACSGSGRIDDGSLDNVRLAILADALEEAGCPPEHEVEMPCECCNGTGNVSLPKGYIGCYRCARHPGERGSGKQKSREPHPLLAHLRSPGPHVRGCWAADLLLIEQ